MLIGGIVFGRISLFPLRRVNLCIKHTLRSELKPTFSHPSYSYSTMSAASSSSTSTSTSSSSSLSTDYSLDSILMKRFFYAPAFEIYGGEKGLYDFGPPGCSLKQNIIDYWRQHFILNENMLQVECTCVTPAPVLKASGHVDRFTDFMVKDEKTNECFRADKYLEEWIDKLLKEDEEKKVNDSSRRSGLLLDRSNAGAMGKADLQHSFEKWNVLTPSGTKFSEPFAFNLMFETQIGPSGSKVGYLRPETAQGIFVNFKRLLAFNNDRMPFAVAQIGLAFRNEIAPRAGLLRVREFPMAEIEHFVHPLEKNHPKFSSISNEILSLLPRNAQDGEDKCIEITASDAVANGIINNQTLAYYITRTQLFLLAIGIKKNKLRFRQHKSNEMAHYAQDCWDAEIKIGSYGWVECVGHADRSAYDLTQHTASSKVELYAQQVFSEPKLISAWKVQPNAAIIGKQFKKLGQPLIEHLKQLSSADALQLKQKLEKGPVEIQLRVAEGDQQFKVEKEMVKIEEKEEKISTEKYIPSVIEPSFGLGRILYAVLDHSYCYEAGKGEPRVWLSIPPLVAPVKVQILTLGNKPEITQFIDPFSERFTFANLSSRVDNSSISIGRKYARADEIGTPFAVTIDFETVTDNCVTLRERDSKQQLRVPNNEVAAVLVELSQGRTTWEKVYEGGKYPKVFRPDDV